MKHITCHVVSSVPRLAPPPGLVRWTAGMPRRPVRGPMDDAGVLDLPTGASAPTEASLEMAKRMSIVFGRWTLLIHDYQLNLSYAPVHDLERLFADGTAIVFAPTIADALETPWAASRRETPITAEELAWFRRECTLQGGTAAIYDPRIRALVFPTSYCALAGLDELVIHELAHALTLRAAWSAAPFRQDLLRGLPRRMEQHVLNPAYVASSATETTRARVLEVLAEAYVWHLAGRIEELPFNVASALVAILQGDVLQSSARAAA